MPRTTMKLGSRYAVAMFFLVTSLLSAAAADISTTSKEAQSWVDRFGILPVMALAAFLAMGWALYASYQFTTNTLLDIVERSIRSNDRLTNAIRSAPCGATIPDSDPIELEPPSNRAVAAIQRRVRRAEKAAE
jgi:hypothetical protein